MTAREIVIEMLGTDEFVIEHPMAVVMGGGCCVFNHNNPTQYKILLANPDIEAGMAVAAGIHEATHVLRAGSGMYSIYQKPADKWTPKERHDEEYAVILWTEMKAEELFAAGRLSREQMDDIGVMCRKGRAAYKMTTIWATYLTAKFAKWASEKVVARMPKEKREMVQQIIDENTKAFSFSA